MLKTAICTCNKAATIAAFVDDGIVQRDYAILLS